MSTNVHKLISQMNPGLGVFTKPEGSPAAPAVNHQPAPAVMPAKPKPPPKSEPKPQPAHDDNDSDDNDGNSGHRHLKHTRPPIHVDWVEKEPKGSPGRGKYRLRQVLGMTKSGYAIVKVNLLSSARAFVVLTNLHL